MNTYLLFKSIHLIAVISWMAGLLYLPRIFVYIMNPAMIVSWIFGILLIHDIGIDNIGFFWLKLKLFFVIVLTVYHFFLFRCLRWFIENNNSFSPKFYRIINEIPTVLLIGIILVVVFKPI